LKCGEFDKRNLEYNKSFSIEKYFSKLININSKESDLRNGKGKIIFDVGAHKGESASFFNKIFPNSKIYSFEPIPLAVKNILNLRLSNVSVHELALSDYDGEAKFNVQDISHLSSLNNINRKSTDSMGYASGEKHETIIVNVSRGDTFINSKNINYVNLLKVDVQSNEIQTLRGFEGALTKIENLMVEVSFYDFYNVSSKIRYIEESLPSFELFDIYEISKNPKTLGTDWATLVYRNTKFIK